MRLYCVVHKNTSQCDERYAATIHLYIEVTMQKQHLLGSTGAARQRRIIMINRKSLRDVIPQYVEINVGD